MSLLDLGDLNDLGVDLDDQGKQKHVRLSNRKSSSPDKVIRTQQMTTDIFLTCSSLVRWRNETKDAFLRRLTHLQLQNQRFGAFGGLQAVPGVQVIYAYDNRIQSMDGLENLRNLQQLFMQNNQVKMLSGLESLPQLRKLHLGHNKIRHIDSLESCKRLEELRVSYQEIDVPMTFCPKSIATIAPTLLVLEVAGNRLPNLLPLVSLTSLQQLDARDNLIEKVLDCRELLERASGLERVDLKGSPFATNERKYRAIIVLCCENIQLIDEKEVSSSEQAFLRRLEEQKIKARRLPAKGGPSALPPVASYGDAYAMIGADKRMSYLPSGKSLR